MKNIHLLPTKKPSRLFKTNSDKLVFDKDNQPIACRTAQHIYITSDEEIKEGDCVYRDSDCVFKITQELLDYYESIKSKDIHKRYKIILTTDQDLIADGVQAIDDEFLEWFVQNPSCEEVKTRKIGNKWIYNADVPQ